MYRCLQENMEGACLCKTYHLETKVLLEILICNDFSVVVCVLGDR